MSESENAREILLLAVERMKAYAADALEAPAGTAEDRAYKSGLLVALAEAFGSIKYAVEVNGADPADYGMDFNTDDLSGM